MRALSWGMMVSLWACVGCLSAEFSQEEGHTRIVGLVPDTDVPFTSPVYVTFSHSVVFPSEGRWGSVLDENGASVAVNAGLSEDERSFVLSPQDAWPAGARLAVQLAEGVVDAEGLAIVNGAQTFEMTTSTPVKPFPTASVRLPVPGRFAPPNLHWIMVLVQGLDGVPARMALEANDDRVPLTIKARSGSRWWLGLKEGAGSCRWLCPGVSYQLALDGVTVLPGLQGSVTTSSVADEVSPTVTSTQVMLNGQGATVSVWAEEPVRALGRATSPQGEVTGLIMQDASGTRVDVASSMPFHTAGQWSWTIALFDLADRPSRVLEFEIEFPEMPQVSLQEVVTSPLRDWGDTEGGEIPFDPYPGHGAVTTSDEWIELVNTSPGPIDLTTTPIEVHALDRSVSITSLVSPPAAYFGDGGHMEHWGPGEALVVRLRGSLSQKNLRIEVHAGGQMLDAVEIGTDRRPDHPGGAPPDTRHEAIAKDVYGQWRWCVPTPGDPLLATSCR